MYLRHTLFILLLLTGYSASAQVWTWMHGDTLYQPVSNASRGLLGVSSPSNLPSIKSGHGYLFLWPDNKDNMWMIELLDLGSSNVTHVIWRYSIASNQWTWMAGFDSFKISSTYPSSVISDYKSSLKNPYSSPISEVNWVDTIGNLWFVSKSGVTNNLFLSKYNIQTSEFELKDYRPNNYSSKGTQGQALSSNFPDLVYTTYWVKGTDDYIYGGINRYGDSISQEMWRFNMNSKLWTWLRGVKSTENKAIYGVKGVANATNQPNSKEDCTKNWVKDTKLYLFGGINFDNFIGDIPNDLWEYDILTNQWTWIHGDTLINREGVYPSAHCIETPAIYPTGRVLKGASIQSKVCDKVFWMFGGGSYNGYYQELWMYKPEENKWLWVSGGKYRPDTNKNYKYGIREVSSLSNKPGVVLPLVFSDSKGAIYTYGGLHIIPNASPGYRNEVWRYDPDYSCVNYRITDKFIDRGIKKYICLGDSTAVNVLKGYDSLRIIPMTDVTLTSTATVTEVWLKPKVNTSYKIIAYGYRCESYLDSLTIPIVVSPPGFGYDTVTICEGSSVYDKTTSGNYTIKIQNPLGCDSTLYLKLTVLPIIRTTLDTTVCEGATVQGHTTSGTYIDTFIAASGCDSIFTLKLTVIPKRLPIDTALCIGSSIAGYSTAGTYYDTLISPQGCITYRVIKLTINYPTSSFLTQSICQGQSYGGHTTSGTYKDTLRNAKGCDSIRTLTLTVKPVSRTTINQSICIGTSYLGRSVAGTYKDTFRNSVGCDSIQTLNLTVRNPIILTKLRDTLVCYGYKTSLDAGLGHRSYLWSTSETSPSIVVDKAGLYRLNYEDNTGCKGRDSAKVDYKPQTTILLVDTISNYRGESLSLVPKILPSGTGRYSWTPANIFSCDTCKSVQFKPQTSVLVRLEYTDEIGCKVSKEVMVNIFETWAVGFPNIFSPNNDSVNDVYFPNTANILSCSYTIYNRWGEKVFEAADYKTKWDGSFKGKPLPSGVYSYYADVVLLNQVKKTYSGEFQLVR